MGLLTSFSLFEMFIAFNLLPAVFVFLWYLIVGDFKNFESSRKAYSEYTATDPVNCYQNFQSNKSK